MLHKLKPKSTLAANDPDVDDAKLITLLKKIYQRNAKATTGLLNETEQVKRSLPFFKRELRLMNHRVCLFRLMANLRDKAAHTFYFMPGFIGYNKDVAKHMFALYKDMKNQTLIDAVIDGELLLDKMNSSTSSSSLHGNLACGRCQSRNVFWHSDLGQIFAVKSAPMILLPM
uniref:NR LBD domain-containing protein n=1 Tax=Globodera pallida TaxID=36090 RepID=A0A183CF30_GLOPA